MASSPFHWPACRRGVQAILLLLALLVPAWLEGQSSGEIIDAWVLDVGADVFGCGTGGTCNLQYRIYDTVGGSPEINLGAGMDGVPRYRRRGAYQTDIALTGNFPAAVGHYEIPFYVVWDGVLSPGGQDHVGYYGAQSQILRFGEVGDSSQVNCQGGGKAVACFEPLSSGVSGQVLRNGISAVGGLAPIPVPRVDFADEESVSLQWDQARGTVSTEGAPTALAGYRLYAYPGAHPSQSALSRAKMVAEMSSIGESRVEIPRSHPGLPVAGEVTFVLKMIYVGNLESAYFSANSEPLNLDDSDDETEDDENPDDESLDDEESLDEGEDGSADSEGQNADGTGGGADGSAAVAGLAGSAGDDPAGVAMGPDTDADGIPDSGDNCVGLGNPEQQDLDLDGLGDACDEDVDGDGIPDDVDCDPGDPAAGLPVLPREVRLQVGQQPGELVSWASDESPWLVYRGVRAAGEPFQYNHTCQAAGITSGRFDAPQGPAAGSTFYYLLAPDSPCAPVAPGHGSSGAARPAGPQCLDVELVQGPEDAPLPWLFRAHGGSGLPVDLELSLRPGTGLAHLAAVSFSLYYDPERVRPRGLPVPGAFLAEAGAPARIDYQDDPVTGTLRITVARTGLGGGQPTEAQVLVVTRWDVLVPGPVDIQMDQVKALDSDYAPVELAGAILRILRR